ncbi:NUC173-domain-containing protein [Lentinula aff. detonsa]|uniref:NUC173-domain-containing protein n=1 Tax=Lentinula aff. detonsa TaxID=2804958 RepID=A0AA38NU53_9AGAR|nr:NUC173-domain-containing protein [Lentinula aff. detonsa]
MDQALAKIRIHVSSSLPHQKTPASLLAALESTFEEQKTERTPTTYFAALLTTLDGTLQKKQTSLNEGDFLPAELYLLALVAPFVSTPVIRGNLSTILALTLPLFPSLLNHAPPLRSQLSLYQLLLISIDRSQLETHGIRQAFASILQLTVDPRPKVRKKATEVVRDVLSRPPSPLLIHPYAERVAEWCRSALVDLNKNVLSKSKGDEGESAIHLLAFLKSTISKFPPSSYSTLTGLLLNLPRLGNPYVSQSSYAILSDLFAHSQEDSAAVFDQNVLPEVLKTVMAFPPAKTDTTLAPSWIQLLGNAMASYSASDSVTCAAQVGLVWKTLWPFLESNNASVRKATVHSLDLLTRCIVTAEASDSKLVDIVAQVAKALTSVSHARAIPDLLSLTSSLLTNLYGKGKRVSDDVVEQRLLALVTQIGNLRTEKGFEYKEDADGTLSTAMRMLGPEVLLDVLPLNLEPEDRQAGLEPRAFLLPLLAQPHPSPLSHFVSYFVPLSERMFDLQQKAETEGRQSEAKVWNVLISQIWAGFPSYCHGTSNIKDTMDVSFSQLVSQLLYGQPELRSPVLRGLRLIVESNVALVNSVPATLNPASVTSEQAALNVMFLRTQAESWLAVLFNVFGSVGRDARGQVGDVITAWAGITSEQEIHKAFVKVVDLLKGNIGKSSSASGKPGNDEENIGTTALDLLLLLLPYLSSADMTALFQMCLSSDVLCAKDNAIQKRAYKILTKLTESGKMTVDSEVVLKELEASSEGLTAAAKKDRFNLFAALIPLIPPSTLHLIPSMIPEAVLGTKETSDKARNAAFELIIAMGQKMGQGGVVKRDMLEEMDEDAAVEATATIDEYLTMVAGGLAGSTPHMISATITAISRLVFDFKDSLTNTMKNEIFTTLLVFLSSANREIVKSVLGYIKLSIHTYPVNLIQPHLKELVPALLTWSHDHKNHFKSKVRHIFERLLRRFSWEDVYSAAGEEEASKVLVNIKKRKERAKRRKANKEEDDEEVPEAKTTAGDVFEDVLYGSESEVDESDDEEGTGGNQSQTRMKGKNQAQGMRLRVDDDEPMDLLQGVASRITSAPSNRRRKPGQDASHFKTDEETGKMVIDQRDDEDDPQAANDVSGTAYRESITSVDGFTRGPNGRIKFNKDTKKRRRDNEDLDMMDVDDGDQSHNKQKRKSSINLGHEFKAKRAGGDVKKGSTDPYAYLSLSQASKKAGGRKNRIGVAGKR